jgi:hypothetical protein
MGTMGMMSVPVMHAMGRRFTAIRSSARAVALHVVQPERQRSTAGNCQHDRQPNSLEPHHKRNIESEQCFWKAEAMRPDASNPDA